MSPRRTKRPDGRYIVNVTVDEPDGTKRRVYFYGRTQSEAKHKAEAARERMAQGAPVRDATRSVSDWLAEWRETFLQASDRASSTKSLYAGLTLRHVEPVIGRAPLGQVRRDSATLHRDRRPARQRYGGALGQYPTAQGQGPATREAAEAEQDPVRPPARASCRWRLHHR